MAELKRELNLWRQDVVARMPLENPHYDPDRAAEWWSRRSVKPITGGPRRVPFPRTEKELERARRSR